MKDLLQPLSDETLTLLLEKARLLTRQRFGRTVQLYAPIYLSNECVDTCTYCGFSLTNRIPRRTLAIEEVVAETEILRAQGFQHILYVSGEHPLHVSAAYLEEVIRNVHPRLASVTIEVAPFATDVYRRLAKAGLDGVVLYQETYNQECYKYHHLAGPKKSYEGRLRAAEEALDAGLRTFGMGVLLGLAPWREEAGALVRHLTDLRKRYWQTEFTISLPRLRPCASDFEPPHPVSDREFLQLIAALRLTLPDIGLVLSTREPAELRDRLIGLGVTRMSAGSRTEPGGYAKPDTALKQFLIEDHRTPAEVAGAIRSKGYDPVWKDFEPI